MSHVGPDEDPRQELGAGRLPALLGGRHRLPGQADLRALGRRLLQEVGQRPRQRRLHVQVDHLQRQAGVASHGVVQAGHGVEFPLPGQDERLAALRQLHLGTQHVLALAPRLPSSRARVSSRIASARRMASSCTRRDARARRTSR